MTGCWARLSCLWSRYAKLNHIHIYSAFDDEDSFKAVKAYGMRRFSDVAVFFLINLDLVSVNQEEIVAYWYRHVHLTQLLSRHAILRSEIEYISQLVASLLTYICGSSKLQNLHQK
jgi:hypothetical protein